MNRVGLFVFFFIFIIFFCFVGVFFIQADTEIKMEDDILVIQNQISNSISAYGYDIDNPNVIVDPYDYGVNSALIMFETDDYVSIKVKVNDSYIYNTKKSSRHYIGVYNLILGSNNIELSYGDKVKKIEINFSLEGASFLEGILLSNNHMLISTDKYMGDDFYTGIREVDALGKIYYEYLLSGGYNNIACEIDDEKLAILSDKLIILDRQNGNILDSFDVSLYKYTWIGMKYIDEKIILYSNDGNIAVDFIGNITEYEGVYEAKYLSGDVNYNNDAGIRFGGEISTKKSKKNVWLLNYSELEEEVNISREFNRIIIENDNINDCDNYLILDKLFDKRVYELCDKVNYIYTYDFDGKYSIYFKFDNKVYKTDKYLNF